MVSIWLSPCFAFRLRILAVRPPKYLPRTLSPANQPGQPSETRSNRRRLRYRPRSCRASVPGHPALRRDVAICRVGPSPLGLADGKRASPALPPTATQERTAKLDPVSAAPC